uniref:Uncharacterized protein n=1 Tax=Octopus bimaculoides TaxID=37653 RepID=A0A0L8GND0_OCTBM
MDALVQINQLTVPRPQYKGTQWEILLLLLSGQCQQIHILLKPHEIPSLFCSSML